MKNISFIVLLFCLSLLFAENVSFETSIGDFEMKVEGTGTAEITSSDIDVANEVAKRVEYFEKNYFAKLNKLDQKRAVKIAEEIYELLSLLPEKITMNVQQSSTTYSTQNADINMNVNINQNMEETVEQSKSSMNSASFSRLLKNISSESFADDKISVLNMAANRNYFTINQTVQVVKLFTHGEDKILAVRKMAPKIVDFENSHNLLKVFTFSEDKKAVQSIINQY